MKGLLYAILMFMCGASQALAQDSVLTVDLAENHVDITTGFNGAQLILFGVQKQKGDIAVVITGPRRDMLVRKKSKIFGIWANTQGIKLTDVPGFYNYALSRAEEEIAAPEVLAQAGIGKDSLRFWPKREYKDQERLEAFQDGLIRSMDEPGMFSIAPGEVVFLSDGFFKTRFYLPSNVPTGAYEIKTFLLRDGAVIDERKTDLMVEQIGASARIYRFAQDHSLAYGLLSVMVAMMIGWFSNAIRRV